jgi:NAD-dependent SIR2 family protein deacetylase
MTEGVPGAPASLPAAADGTPGGACDIEIDTAIHASTHALAEADIDALAAFVNKYRRLFILTGAGCSTESGIADYRDTDGAWKRPMPTTFQAFTGDTLMRARYWARSMIGWRSFGKTQPNPAHRALAEWERAGRIDLLVTQNVDGLHEAAGSKGVVDLHGRLDTVCCLKCGHRFPRDDMQRILDARNPAWVALEATLGPDGDADLENAAFAEFDIPDHEGCGGMLKPDVVFFGESVPRDRVDRALRSLDEADGVLIVGSSLMVYSGYRFALGAAERGLPLAAINIGHTRADALLSLKVQASAASVLNAVTERLAG